MIRIRDHKQREIFDLWDFLRPKRRQLLDQSWPGMFRQHLLSELPVGSLIPYFTDGFGRPSKELYTVRDPENDKEAGGPPNHVFSIVKEHFFAVLGRLRRWLKDFASDNEHMLIIWLSLKF